MSEIRSRLRRKSARPAVPDLRIRTLCETLTNQRIRLAEAILGRGSFRAVHAELDKLKMCSEPKPVEAERDGLRVPEEVGSMARPRRSKRKFSSIAEQGDSKQDVRKRNVFASRRSSTKSQISNSTSVEDESECGEDRENEPPRRALASKSLRSPGYKLKSKYLAKYYGKSDVDGSESSSKNERKETRSGEAGPSQGLGYRWISTNEDNADLCAGSEAWFKRVKDFRESNKTSCCATEDKVSMRELDKPHECTHYYRMNDRLFASPVWKDEAGRSVCVDCKTPRRESQPVNVSVVVPETVSRQADVVAGTPGKFRTRVAPLAWDSQKRFRRPNRFSKFKK